MRTVYNILLVIGFVLGLPWFLWKGRASGKYVRTFRERMGRLPVYLNLDGDRSIWIHAVSVGEVLAARPLVPALRERFPSHRIFLSTTTVTGNEVAKKSVRGLDGLFFAPFDFPHAVRRALEVVNPALLLLVETELWPNLIHEANRRGARIALVNEQAYSAGLIRHYLDAGYAAIVMEWDNPSRLQTWDPEWRFLPQRACGQHGEEIPVIWNKSIAFQQFQRYAHAELELDEYLEFITSRLSENPRAFSLYEQACVQWGEKKACDAFGPLLEKKDKERARAFYAEQCARTQDKAACASQKRLGGGTR